MRFGRILELGLTSRVPESEENKPKEPGRSETAPYDVEAELRRIGEEGTRKRLEKKFVWHEKEIDRALSDNPTEAYRQAGVAPTHQDSWPFLRLTYLAGALDSMEAFRERLPERYQANINKVRERAEDIKKIFHEYRLLREKGEARGLHDAAALLSAIETLRKIDPDQFPLELVDVSKEDRDSLDAMSHFAVRQEENDKPQPDSVTPSH